jgi:hypothetical protein
LQWGSQLATQQKQESAYAGEGAGAAGGASASIPEPLRVPCWAHHCSTHQQHQQPYWQPPAGVRGCNSGGGQQQQRAGHGVERGPLGTELITINGVDLFLSMWGWHCVSTCWYQRLLCPAGQLLVPTALAAAGGCGSPWCCPPCRRSCIRLEDGSLRNTQVRAVHVDVYLLSCQVFPVRTRHRWHTCT